MAPSPTFIDLFAGAGGLSYGLARAGWRPLLAVDHDAAALATYAANLPGVPVVCADIARLFPAAWPRPDWVVGGPPCQGFSTVGRRDAGDPRNQLVDQFARVVAELRPRGFVIENVLGMRDMDVVDAVAERFIALGYRVSAFVVTAALHGVPQLRRRQLFVGSADGRAFLHLPPTHPPVSVWDAIGDLPPLLPGEAATAYDRPALTDYQARMRGASAGLQGHAASRHPAALLRAIAHIPDGGDRTAIPPELQPRSGFHNSYARLDSRKPAVAVTQNMGKPSGTRCIHPFQDRGLTTREGARLQGFPDVFHFTGSVSEQRLQVANAVSPILAEALGRALANDAYWTP